MCFSCESFQVLAVKLQRHEFFVTRSGETSAWIGQEIAMITFLEVPKIRAGFLPSVLMTLFDVQDFGKR